MLGAFEFDGAGAERRGEAGVSHPHGGQRRRVAANSDVDAEPGVVQAQVRLGEYEPEVAQFLGGAAEAEMDDGAAGGQQSVLTVPRIHHMSSPVSDVSSKIGRLSQRSLQMPISAMTGPSSSPAEVRWYSLPLPSGRC